MPSLIDPEPDQGGSDIRIGQDIAGHWLVQGGGGRLEGRFISFAAAEQFARSERHVFPGAAIILSPTPLVPTVSFAPLEPWETALPNAASTRTAGARR